MTLCANSDIRERTKTVRFYQFLEWRITETSSILAVLLDMIWPEILLFDLWTHDPFNYQPSALNTISWHEKIVILSFYASNTMLKNYAKRCSFV